MEAKVIWQNGLAFTGIANKGHQIQLDSNPSENAASPMELVAMAIAGCTAMDVISVLEKKREAVTSFEVKIHADRAADYPKVFTKADVEYIVVGHDVQEEAVIRAIELSVTKYCPVHAMLEKVFPIDLHYSIYEDEGSGKQRLVKQGIYQHTH
ncbi:MAG: OsmC family protein [Chloroflexi bacterium]|nr:OsmC family protein [Chloroflexota bacterium]